GGDGQRRIDLVVRAETGGEVGADRGDAGEARVVEGGGEAILRRGRLDRLLERLVQRQVLGEQSPVVRLGELTAHELRDEAPLLGGGVLLAGGVPQHDGERRGGERSWILRSGLRGGRGGGRHGSPGVGADGPGPGRRRDPGSVGRGRDRTVSDTVSSRVCGPRSGKATLTTRRGIPVSPSST